MRHAPAIDHAELMAAVREAYGLPVAELTFVPVGYVAACYVLHWADGTRAFLKLWPDTHAGRVGAERRFVALPLARALYERGLYPRVPYPLLTRQGALWASCAGAPFAVFPLLAGHAPPPWEDWPPALREELARTIAAIHRATPALADVLPPPERFDIPCAAGLLSGLERAARASPQERWGLRELRSMLLPRRGEVLAQLARLRRLRARVCQLPGPLVLCHTDIGGDNLLVGADGRLSVLDWDDAVLAPAAFDLQSAAGAGFGPFLQRYRDWGGAGPLHLEHFAFYLLRRALDDMTARLLSMLDEHHSDEQDAEALSGIEQWGFRQWSALDRTLAEIAEALRWAGMEG